MCSLNYCCGPSWAGVVNGIAITDIVTSVIPVTLESVSAGTLLGIVVPLGKRSNCSSSENFSNSDISSNCSGWLYDYVGDDIHFDFDTYTVTALILFVLIGFIVEGYLFSTLRRGVHEQIHKDCKKWFYYRLLLLVLTTLGSVGKYLRDQYYIPTDGLLDILKVYRIVSIIIVSYYMTELAHTVGIIYIKPAKRPKRGSL